MSELLTAPHPSEQAGQPEVASNVGLDSLERTSVLPVPAVVEESPEVHGARLNALRKEVTRVHKAAETGGSIYTYNRAEVDAWKRNQGARKAEKQAEYETWKQQRQADKNARLAEQNAKLEAWRAEHPAPSPEQQRARSQWAQRRVEQDREQTRRVDLQLDTEELHAKLGKPGLRRLLRPFRNAKILFTVAKRSRAGEYNPNLEKFGALRTPDGLIDPFTVADDPVAQARYRRGRERREAEERAKLINPFEN